MLTIASTSMLTGINTVNAQEQASEVSAEISIVNINTANVEMLTSLPGIGPSKAESIVSYRELNGEFKSVAELANVKGIGKRMVERLTNRVSV